MHSTISPDMRLRPAKKVALIHYWMVSMRGGERVFESLCRMFPDADVYTNLALPENLSSVITRHKITETFIARLPFSRRGMYRHYLPLMPMALESLDLTDYDLVISNEAGPAKGIVPAPGAVHLNYCCSPMRYVWDQYHVYRARAGFLSRLLLPLVTHFLRIWDVTAAARVDHFLADSHHVANRIRRYYHRSADVVYPPVAISEFLPVPEQELSDFYLWCGELVRYKRPDVAIEAFNDSGRPLIVIGDGEERRRLQKVAKSNITFLGRASFDDLKWHLARCRALIFPGEEDFGIVPLEAQAAGRPVIALARGGALETVVDQETGLFFDEPTAVALNGAIARFEDTGLGERCGTACRRNAERFSEANFHAGIAAALRSLGIDPPVPADAGPNPRAAAGNG